MNKTLLFAILLVIIIGFTGASALAQSSVSSSSSSYTSPYSSDYSFSTFDTDPPGEMILADVLILRPLGIASQIVGIAGSIVSLPWAASSCSGCLVQKRLLQEPFEYTWCRKLGDVDY